MDSGAPARVNAISSRSRVELLQLLRDRPRQTVSGLADATGLHANTVREHLQRLIGDGYVVACTEHRTTRGRPRVLYAVADGEGASSPVQRRKVHDAAARGDILRRILPDEADRTLDTETLHQVDALVEDLVDGGFDPLVDAVALTIDLTPCAHAGSQADHREVLCGVHLTLLQGVLSEAGGPLSIAGMTPDRDDPSVCVVRLRRGAGGDGSARAAAGRGHTARA